MDVGSRADLKSDLLKDLERHKSQLNGYRGNPSISEAALDEVVGPHRQRVRQPQRASPARRARRWPATSG